MSLVKTYKKHVVLRSVGGKSVEKNEDGSPKLRECIKENVRITPEMAATLNHGWDSTQKPISFYWIIDESSTERDDAKQISKKAKAKTSIDKLKAQSDELVTLEMEKKSLKLKDEIEELKATKAPVKKELVEECEDLEIDSTGTVKQLKERLANHKAN